MAASSRILVVGAGIAGLTTARALRLAGFRPEVVERHPATVVPTSGIFLPGNAARALARLGLDDPLRHLGQVIRWQRFLDERGEQLCRVDLAALWDGVGECRALPRDELHQVLLRGAGGEVRYGTEVTALHPRTDGVEVVFGDGTRREYDLVIGADGRRSAVRAMAALGGPARPTGRVVYRSVITGGPEVTDWTALLGDRCGLVVVPLGGGRLYCCADETGSAAPADPLDRLRQVFGGFGDPVPAILAAIRTVQVALTDEVQLGRWSYGRVVVVGDAAHATSPSLAQGAAMAIEDAVVLAEELRRATDLDEALLRYESRRRPRTKWVLDRTRDRDRTRDVPPPLRDPVLRGRGERIFQEHYRLLVDPV